MFTIEYIPIDNIQSIEKEWRLLEVGSEMTYFQSFDWYRMLVPYTPRKKGVVEVVFVVVYNSNVPLLIAPLWIIKRNYLFVNRKGIYFMGRKGCTDYLNFIYNHFSSDCMDFLLSSLDRRYGITYFLFENLLETTSSYIYLKNRYSNKLVKRVICGKVILPVSIETYHKVLSKNSRKNIRLAYNRLRTDQIEYKVVFDDVNANRKRCSQIRDSRLKMKQSYSTSILIKLKSFVYHCLAINFPECIQHLEDRKSHILSVYCDGKLCMFFCYGIDEIHHVIVLMTAGVDVNYSRYSLGIIGLFEFIQHVINQGDINSIDFLRGGEHYKHTLGGQDHYISDIEIIIKR